MLAEKMTFAPVTAVVNDDCKSVIEGIFVCDVASEAPVPLSMVRPSRTSRTHRAAPGDDVCVDPNGAAKTTSLPPS